MVVDITYYELLGIHASATPLEIKKAYRKSAVRLHPDKNPDDPQAAAKFQEVGQAYQVLSDEKLRERYDKFGIEELIPKEGFEDPAEFFSIIFGGEAFKDWIGELSLLLEMSKSAELSGYGNETPAKPAKPAEDVKTFNAKQTGPFSTNPNVRVLRLSESIDTRLDIGKEDIQVHSTDRSNVLLLEHASDGISDPEEEKRRKQEELEKYEEECRIKKVETRNELALKLVSKLLLFTETDMAQDVSDSFKQKLKYEAESLKMESFGLEILHCIGSIYKTKARILLKSQTFLGGLGGLWWSMKEKGGVIRDTFNTVTLALDAQLTMQEYTKMQEDNEYHARKEAEQAEIMQDAVDESSRDAEAEKEKARKEVEALEKKLQELHEGKAEEANGKSQKKDNEKEKDKDNKKEPERHTAEELAEMEKFLIGKVLAAAWSGSKFEIQGTVRAVCDQVLYDEDVPLQTRVARAKGMKIIGQVFSETTRTEAEAEEARMFEELVAEASQKRKKAKPEPKKKEA